MDAIEKPTPEEERLERLMEEANVNYAQRDEFRADPIRAVALLEHALSRRKVEKPAAYALSRFRRGEWPGRTNGGDRSRPSSAYEIASRWIYGHGWDESFGRREMVDDLEGIYARRGERLRDVDRERLLSAWDAEYLRRYPPEPALVEWAPPREALAEELPPTLFGS
jgi:hypothetical protein